MQKCLLIDRRTIKGTRHILMIAVVAYDNEMDNELTEHLLSDPDLIYHKNNKEHDRAQDTGRKQVNN